MVTTATTATADATHAFYESDTITTDATHAATNAICTTTTCRTTPDASEMPGLRRGPIDIHGDRSELQLLSVQ